ncbi:M55 family metallopeptidase [Paenibacillus sp. R14(2021)]|uniref:M55 family metallopeptidase n=1 Tax=Paenibacillus sp. R14(2021) TaxID=2859228 RepID=UPI0035BE17AF
MSACLSITIDLINVVQFSVDNPTINETEVGEIGFNAIYAGLLGVPLVLVTGDDKASEETNGIVPDAITGIVKHALSRTSAICLSLEQSRKELVAKTKEAMGKINQRYTSNSCIAVRRKSLRAYPVYGDFRTVS